MNKVKTDNVFVNKLTCLLNMGSESLSQRRLKKMGSGMVALYRIALRSVNRKNCLFVNGYILTLNNSAVVENDAVCSFCCVGHFKNSIFGSDQTLVADLSAALAVERTDIKNKNSFVFACEKICFFAVRNNGNDCSFTFKR